MFKISDEIKQKLKENGFQLDEFYRLNTLSNESGDLFDIRFKMEGHFKRFPEFINKHSRLYCCGPIYEYPHYVYYILIDLDYSEISKECKKNYMHKFYIQIFQDKIFFNMVSRRFSIEPFCKLFELIKNKIDPNTELWIGKEKLI